MINFSISYSLYYNIISNNSIYEDISSRKNKVKVASYTFEKVGNYWNAKEVNMKDIKRKHSTKMIMSDVKFDTGLSDDEFTLRKLKQ